MFTLKKSLYCRTLSILKMLFYLKGNTFSKIYFVLEFQMKLIDFYL